MKQKVLTSLLLAGAMCANLNAGNSEEEPDWVATLENNEIIDSIVALEPSQIALDNDLTSYHLYYHQPLCHEQPELGTFQLRCSFVVPNDNNLFTCADQVYFSGYDIDGYYWNCPDTLYMLSTTVSDVARRYHANQFYFEHRYFSGSAPEDCWEKPEYCNANEASQDFHALIEALKTVFQGKWVISGVSKGGITTAMQHAFFPDDADIYIPKSAPFCKGLTDKRMYQYITANGWEKETRDRYYNMTRKLLEDSETQSYFLDEMLQADDSIAWKTYYYVVMDMTTGVHAYTPRNMVDSIMDRNEAMKQLILDTYDFSAFAPASAETVLNAYYVNAGNFDASKAWQDFLPKEENAAKQARARSFSMTEQEWKSMPLMAYNYQACRELGRYSCDMRCLYEEGSKLYTDFAEPLQKIYDQICPEIIISCPMLKDVEYDGHELFDMVEEKTQNATKPIVFLYGEDDAWTGAAMEDEYINGDNVRKYILAGQPHSFGIDSDPAQNGEIWEFIDKVMLGKTVGIDQMTSSTPSQAVYYDINGQRINGKPTQSGIYCVGGKKVFIK